MAYDDVINTLADPTRRAVLDALRDGPRAVGDVAEGLPVTRPAVSQHLKALKEAGLVDEARRGARRLYWIKADGVAAAQGYLDALMEAAKASEGAAAALLDPAGFDPVFKIVELAVGPARAFETFTSRIADWWPLTQRSRSLEIAGAPASYCAVEPREGGAIYESAPDGARLDWGEVREWAPPARLVLAWTMGRPAAQATEVELRFLDLYAADPDAPDAPDGIDATGAACGACRVDAGARTRVELKHRGWERLGADARALREQYEKGWDDALARFAAAAHA